MKKLMKNNLMRVMMLMLVIPVMFAMVGCGKVDASTGRGIAPGEGSIELQSATTDADMKVAILGVWEATTLGLTSSAWNEYTWVFMPQTWHWVKDTTGTHAANWTISNGALNLLPLNMLNDELNNIPICFSNNNNTFTLFVDTKLETPEEEDDDDGDSGSDKPWRPKPERGTNQGETPEVFETTMHRVVVFHRVIA